MELHRIRCTQCGADFDSYDPSVRFMKCTRMGCGAVFVVEQGINFASVQAQKAEEIGNLRHALENAVNAKNHEMVYRYAADIQAILPDDFIANFWIALLSVRLHDKHPKLYKEFLNSERTATGEEAEKCADYAIENAQEHFHKDIRAFLDRHLTPENAKKKKGELKAHLFRLRELNKTSGEIFILSDDDGGEIADRLYDGLKKMNADVWSERKNLSVDTTGYTARIREAAEECCVMVIVASGTLVRNAGCKNMISQRVKSGIPLICVKADDMPFTSTFSKLIGDAPVIGFGEEDAVRKVFDYAGEAMNPAQEEAEEVSVPESEKSEEKTEEKLEVRELEIPEITGNIETHVITLDDLDMDFDSGYEDPFELPGIENAGSCFDEDPLSPPRFSGCGYDDPKKTFSIDHDTKIKLYKDLEEIRNLKDATDDILLPPSLSGEDDELEPPMLLF